MKCPTGPDLTFDILDSVLRSNSSDCTCEYMMQFLSQNKTKIYCDPFPFQHTVPAQLIYNSLFIATIFFALVGNFTVIWIVLCHERMRTVTNYYLLNLAVADAAISVMNTGFTWSFNFYYVWRFGSFYCGVNNLMGITPICASVFTMIVMSIDRYWAIVHPLRRRPGRKATVAVIIVIWILSIMCGIPAVLASTVEVNYFWDGVELFEDPVCLADNFPDGGALESHLYVAYNTFLTLVQYVIPLFILSFAYYRVGVVLRKKEVLGDSRHIRSVAQKRKASTMLSLVVFIFMIVWFPYNAYFVYTNYGGHLDLDPIITIYIYINVYWLGMSSTVFNPVIYYFMNKRFRIGFRYAFRWLPFVECDVKDYHSLLQPHPRPSMVTYNTLHTQYSEF